MGFKKLHLIASENIQSPLVKVCHLSKFSERYYLTNGIYEDPKQSPYPILAGWPELNEAGNELVCRVFRSEWVDPRPLSGTHAMNCLLASFAPGDAIVICPESMGGHFATEHMAKRLGLRVSYATYDSSTGKIDTMASAETAKQVNAKLFTLDTSHQLRPHPVRELKALLPKDTVLSYDASHVLALLLGGVLQTPLEEGADLIQAGCHKSFPGPQKAIFFGRSPKLKEKLSETLFPQFSSNYQLHHVLAFYAATLELQLFGENYARQIILNARALAKELVSKGIPLFGANWNYTETHQVWIDLDSQWAHRLSQNGILLTQFVVPNGGGRKALRIGTSLLTRLGMVEEDMAAVAELIAEGFEKPEPHLLLQRRVHDFMSCFNDNSYCLQNLNTVKEMGPVGRLIVQSLQEDGLEPVFNALVKNRPELVSLPPLKGEEVLHLSVLRQ